MPDLTIAEAATVLGVSADTIRRRIKAGDRAAHRDGRGRYVVTRPDEAGALGPDELAQQAPRHA